MENEEKIKKKHTHTQQSETSPHKKLQNTKTRHHLSPENTEQRI
jgi:hypothetical protein